tara:strand:- start:185 stop:556 length:372 start_codon:yes stop_codon:yes gene_type:complete
MMNNFSAEWPLISIWVAGTSGLILIAIYVSKSERFDNIAKYLVNFSVATILIQTAGELLLFSEIIEPGSFHLFYKVVVLFTLTFLYVYRTEMNKNYLLYWGIALLFIMGLEIRAIMTLGRMLI